MTIRRILGALLAVAVAGGAGALALDRLVDGEDGRVASEGPTTGVAQGSTSTSSRASGFPADVPRSGDEECSAPRTDLDRPAIPATGEPTDGVEVTNPTVADAAEAAVVFRARVSHAPVVAATSGSRWVVIELSGVRTADTPRPTIESAHARSEPASTCDDSTVVYAFSVDALVTGVELTTNDGETVEVLVRL